MSCIASPASPTMASSFKNPRLHKSSRATEGAVGISESYRHLLTVLTGACQTRAEANRNPQPFPPARIQYSHMCFISIMTGTYQ